MGKTERVIISVILLLAFCCLSLFSCKDKNGNGTGNSNETQGNSESTQDFKGLSVYFLDIDDGDATLIVFPEGNGLLIGGGKTKHDAERIKDIVQERCKNGLSYLMLSGIEKDKLINAEYFTENCSVKKVYLPYLYKVCYDFYPEYAEIMQTLTDKGIDYEYNESGVKIENGGCFIGVLTPYGHGLSTSAYRPLIELPTMTQDAYDDISPILYLEYKGVRFVLSDYAGFSQEELISEANGIGYFDRLFERKINLSKVDLVKIPRHGGKGVCSEEYCMLLNTLNAVISVRGDNPSGNPKTEVLTRFLYNENCMFYRTDVKGDILARISTEGVFSVDYVDIGI